MPVRVHTIKTISWDCTRLVSTYLAALGFGLVLIRVLVGVGALGAALALALAGGVVGGVVGVGANVGRPVVVAGAEGALLVDGEDAVDGSGGVGGGQGTAELVGVDGAEGRHGDAEHGEGQSHLGGEVVVVVSISRGVGFRWSKGFGCLCCRWW